MAMTIHPFNEKEIHYKDTQHSYAYTVW